MTKIILTALDSPVVGGLCTLVVAAVVYLTVRSVFCTLSYFNPKDEEEIPE
jgi:hypothetical protein